MGALLPPCCLWAGIWFPWQPWHWQEHAVQWAGSLAPPSCALESPRGPAASQRGRICCPNPDPSLWIPDLRLGPPARSVPPPSPRLCDSSLWLSVLRTARSHHSLGTGVAGGTQDSLPSAQRCWKSIQGAGRAQGQAGRPGTGGAVSPRVARPRQRQSGWTLTSQAAAPG